MGDTLCPNDRETFRIRRGEPYLPARGSISTLLILLLLLGELSGDFLVKFRMVFLAGAAQPVRAFVRCGHVRAETVITTWAT